MLETNLLVRGAGRNLATVRAEPHTVHEVGVLAVVGVIHLERGALVKNSPVVLAPRHDAVGPDLSVVAADNPLAVTYHLSEVAPGIPHESASIHPRARAATHDALALGPPREIFDSPAQAVDFDLQLVFRVVPRPNPNLFLMLNVESVLRHVKGITTQFFEQTGHCLSLLLLVSVAKVYFEV